MEIVSLQRYASGDGEKLYDFSPFLGDVDAASTTSPGKSGGPTIDPSEIDTIVVPARKEGFEDVFIGEDCWYSIRIHSSMLSKIKYVAAYQAAPISAITHIAPVDRIEQWKDTSKYILYFDAPAKKIQSIKLVSKGRVKAPQSPRYTAKHLLDAAKDMDGVF